jgi:hypothetical protein
MSVEPPGAKPTMSWFLLDEASDFSIPMRPF